MYFNTDFQKKQLFFSFFLEKMDIFLPTAKNRAKQPKRPQHLVTEVDKVRNRRTDLALEARELWQESAEETTELSGVKAEDTLREGFPVTTVRILDKAGEDALGKPPGTYITLTLDGLQRQEEDSFSRAVRAVAGELSTLLPSSVEKSPVLVAGLGNRAITPDAIGPKVHEHTLVTRHLISHVPEHFGHFRSVASLATGVLGTTGIESGQMVHSLCTQLRPACVIAVDALASRSVSRLCRTVQLSDTGITPGSGVGNHRFALTRESLGIPVIAIGVPTVVDAATLAADLLDCPEPQPPDNTEGLLVTPKDIDRQVKELSRVIGYGINLALQPGLTVEDLNLLLG